MGFLFPKQPEAKPVRMPVAGDAEQRNAAARERKNIGERTGRSSTVMSRQAPGAAGTQAYTNSLLGQAV